MDIFSLLHLSGISPALSPNEGEKAAQKLEKVSGAPVYPHSIIAKDGLLYFLSRKQGKKILGILSASRQKPSDFSGEQTPASVEGRTCWLTICPLSGANARALRQTLEFLRPGLVGLRTSVGLGDRLGLATPGHVRAARGKGLAVFFAQQSSREMSRTGRMPQQVVDDVTWGLFQEGWREGLGADADHLKTIEDTNSCIRAGFTFFTVDPGDHVDSAADTDSASLSREKTNSLPWEDLETNWNELRSTYMGKQFQAGQFAFDFGEEHLLRATVKYGRAIAHTTRMYRHIAQQVKKNAFELEVSVDETQTPTTPREHIFVANELRRLGVEWVSLAPRFVGRFEKGVDYIGDLQAFEEDFSRHAAISREFGPYKLSVHSGSDKFSIYPIAAQASDGLVHVKTAGTSYLEALRAAAQLQPDLFREIVALARERYPQDRASYHVSAELSQVPDPHSSDAGALNTMLDQFHSREVLHVTYGSVLDRFGERLLAVLREDEEVYYRMLERHITRHLAPFSR